MNAIRLLEPKTEPKGEIIYKMVQDINEIKFIMKGSIEVGFEIDREAKYVIRL